MTKAPVCILGAGITGLATAWYLEKAGIKDILILEQTDRTGGKIRTIKDDGFLIESGADSFVTTKPFALDLIEEIGMSRDLIEPKTNRFYILKNGHLVDVPAGLKMMSVINREAFEDNKLFSAEAIGRILKEEDIPALMETSDESLGSFVRRRFGNEMLELYVEPLFGGIYATPADELSIEATFPMFRMLEKKYGSLTAAVNALYTAEKGTPNRSGFMSLKNGMQSLTDGLASQLKHTRIIYQSQITDISNTAEGYLTIRTTTGAFESKKVISTISAAQFADILKSPLLTGIWQSFSFSSSHIITLAYERKQINHSLQATGYVVPRTEHTPVTASTWSSEKWDYRAPENFALIRCFFSKDQNEKTDNDLLQTAHEALSEVLNITGNPYKWWVSRYTHSLPQYKTGHFERVSELENRLKKLYPNILLAGASYHGVGIPDCIKQAKEAVDNIMAE